MTSNFTAFNIENEEYVFSANKFKKLMLNEQYSRKKEGDKCTVDELKQELAEYVCVSDETVRKWYKGANGPSSLEIIKSISNFFNVEYLDLMHKKSGGKEMVKEMINMGTNEKDVIAGVYTKLVEIIWFETNRLNENFEDAKYQDYREFNKKWEELFNDAYKYIDINSLLISYETRIELYNILTEARKMNCGMEAVPSRWIRINPLVFEAREYFDVGGFIEDEDEKINILHQDAEGKIERPYCVEIGNRFFGGFTKSTSIKEAALTINSLDNTVNLEKVVLKPYPDDQFDYQYSPDEIFRFELMKTITLIFRETFEGLF